LYRKHAPAPIADLQVIDVSEKMKGLTLADEDVPLVHELDLDALPAGRISKLWVVLFEDALKPMTVPVIIAKGTSLVKISIDSRISAWAGGGNDIFVTWRRSQWSTSHSPSLSNRTRP
jgi:hypothetical protein